MPKPKQVDDLQIDDDMDFQRKEWRIERIAWIIMVLLALAGLLGLFGEGPLSNVNAANGPIEVQYDRFERLLSPAQMVVQVGPAGAQNEEVRLRVGRKLLDGLQVQNITPQPDSMELMPEEIVYVFNVKEPNAPMRITFDMQTAKAGSHGGQIGIENGAAVDVRQFIYP